MGVEDDGRDGRDHTEGREGRGGRAGTGIDLSHNTLMAIFIVLLH